MIYFAQAQYLLLLLLVPVFLIVYGLVQYGRTRRIRKFGNEALVKQLMPSYSKTKGWVGDDTFLIGLHVLQHRIGTTSDRCQT